MGLVWLVLGAGMVSLHQAWQLHYCEDGVGSPVAMNLFVVNIGADPEGHKPLGSPLLEIGNEVVVMVAAADPAQLVRGLPPLRFLILELIGLPSKSLDGAQLVQQYWGFHGLWMSLDLAAPYMTQLPGEWRIGEGREIKLIRSLLND